MEEILCVLEVLLDIFIPPIAVLTVIAFLDTLCA